MKKKYDELWDFKNLDIIYIAKPTIEEIKEKISICRGIIKWLKIQDKTYTIDERLSLRLEFNKQIGIYDL
jgi:hypothetical protein